ncbi:MAG: hypothetical protein JXA25_01120 [Anaerolineales bacterium]|nr:hypothetical protein [Anaerolineales bacterium]
MGRKAAALITAALTIFVLGAGVLVAIRFTDPIKVQAADAAAAEQSILESQLETLLSREMQYQASMDTANQRIAEANSRIAALQQEKKTLEEQNGLLLEREDAFSLAIAEANALLAELAAIPEVIIVPSSPSSSSGSDASSTSDHDREDENHEEDHDDDGEHDDD